MSAVDTLLRVLKWAQTSEADRGHVPRGDLRGLHELANPSPELRRALGQICAVTAGRLALGSPPLQDHSEAGAGALWLAAAAGAAHEKVAMEIVAACGLARSASKAATWELIARHAVVEPASHHVPPTLAESLISVSPLTGLLTFPARGTEDALQVLGERWLGHEDGRRLLVKTFSSPPEGSPSDQSPRLLWRSRFLESLRHPQGDMAFVLDVYEAAIALHREAWLERTKVAAYILSRPEAPQAQLDFALAVAGWWDPLRGLHSSHLKWVRERKYMDFHVYLEGIKVATAGARLSEGLPG